MVPWDKAGPLSDETPNDPIAAGTAKDVTSESRWSQSRISGLPDPSDLIKGIVHRYCPVQLLALGRSKAKKRKSHCS